MVEIPKTEHFAVVTVTKQTIYHPGDQRSRERPGHGYPEHTEPVESIDYKPFSNRKELNDYLKLMFERRETSYRILHVKPMKVHMSLDVVYIDQEKGND